MGAFDKTQAELRRFQEEVLEAARRVLPEKVEEYAVGSMLRVLQGVLGRTQAGVAGGGVTRRLPGTPVDTGRLRGEWQVGIGRPRRNQLGESARDESGAKTLSRELPNLQRELPQFPVLYLTNNMPYGPLLEAGAVRPIPPNQPAFLFKAVQLAREQLREDLREERDLLDEGTR